MNRHHALNNKNIPHFTEFPRATEMPSRGLFVAYGDTSRRGYTMACCAAGMLKGDARCAENHAEARPPAAAAIGARHLRVRSARRGACLGIHSIVAEQLRIRSTARKPCLGVRSIGEGQLGIRSAARRACLGVRSIGVGQVSIPSPACRSCLGVRSSGARESDLLSAARRARLGVRSGCSAAAAPDCPAQSHATACTSRGRPRSGNTDNANHLCRPGPAAPKSTACTLRPPSGFCSPSCRDAVLQGSEALERSPGETLRGQRALQSPPPA